MDIVQHLKDHPNRIGITVGLILLAFIVVTILLKQFH